MVFGVVKYLVQYIAGSRMKGQEYGWNHVAPVQYVRLLALL